jgi:hypothetical protein
VGAPYGFEAVRENVLAMTEHALTRLAWVTYFVSGVALMGALGCFIYLRVTGAPWDPGFAIAPLLLFIFPTVGILVARVQPRNPIGWTLLGIGLAWGLLFLAEPYIWYAYIGKPGSLWRPDLVVALTSSLWIPAVGLTGIFLILLFPNGRLSSPRWRPFSWVAGVNLAVQFMVTPFIPLTLRGISSQNPDVPRAANPLGIEALRFIVPAWNFGIVLIALSFVASAVSLVLRFRRSRGHERLQLKWIAAAGAAVASFFLIFLLLVIITEVLRMGAQWAALLDSIFENTAPIVFALLPIAMGIAILRHRLYDIDVIINRALVYGVLTIFLALVYVAGVVGFGGAVRGVTGQGDNSLAIAATTLAIAGLFGPARARVQRFIDRRFYRHKYDAAKTVESFSTRLRDEIDLDALCAELVDTVAYTMQPTKVSVWLRGSNPT